MDWRCVYYHSNEEDIINFTNIKIRHFIFMYTGAIGIIVGHPLDTVKVHIKHSL